MSVHAPLWYTKLILHDTRNRGIIIVWYILLHRYYIRGGKNHDNDVALNNLKNHIINIFPACLSRNL